MRFSLRWLFGSVAFMAVGCSSLSYAAPLIASAVWVSLNAFLGLSVLAAVYSSKSRAFWGGVAIIGFGYVASGYLPVDEWQLLIAQSREINLDPWRPLAPWQIADQALRMRYERVNQYVALKDDDYLETGYPEGAFRDNADGAYHVSLPLRRPFLLAGHAMTAFVLAVAGGMVATRLDSRARRAAA